MIQKENNSDLRYSVGRKMLVFGIVVVLMISIFGIIKHNSIASVVKEYDIFTEKVVEGKFLVIEIEKEMNYISRATRDIMLGNSYKSNYDRLLLSKSIILEKFDKLEKTLKDMPNEKEGLETLQISREKTVRFIDDGIEKMQQLGKVERTPEVLAAMYQEYKKDATPLANANRDAFAKIVEKREKKMEEKSKNLHKQLQDFDEFVITESIVLLMFILISFILLFRSITNSLNKFKEGLTNFFMFLNREKSSVELIDVSNKDEFGSMARIINDNIKKIEKSIIEDNESIEQIIKAFGEFEKGDLSQQIKGNKGINPSLNKLKDVLNNMANNLNKNVDNVLKILGEYSKNNYLNKVNTTGLKENLLKLANDVNVLGGTITNILVENKENGLTLKESSKVLLQNVEKLNESTRSGAASLEETSAALEEITSNIRNNTENIAKMVRYSNEITKASSEGENLANKTTVAMDEINHQVNLVNDAIVVIDQIAFQTNILSLNAAVEAATAGESGKGFAVVRQEVRNLANRSAEAAKQIKSIVENATIKANDGKVIASHMIKGYTNLNDNITKTLTLISNVEMASKEQLLGIEQINDAVGLLDKQTQENANIANVTHNIANKIDGISSVILQNANDKEFIGKDSVVIKN